MTEKIKVEAYTPQEMKEALKRTHTTGGKIAMLLANEHRLLRPSYPKRQVGDSVYHIYQTGLWWYVCPVKYDVVAASKPGSPNLWLGFLGTTEPAHWINERCCYSNVDAAFAMAEKLGVLYRELKEHYYAS